jgi:hypothetical protein
MTYGQALIPIVAVYLLTKNRNARLLAFGLVFLLAA